MSSPAARLDRAWRVLSPLPGGRWLFRQVIRIFVPYSGSIRPDVSRMGPGHATVAIRDRRRLRNHLRSIHALALANLGELASGLAMVLSLPTGVRGIPLRIEAEYMKKARGRITAEGRATPPTEVEGDVEAEATAELRDDAGDLVARVTVHWRLSA
ncbi:MAG TPA: DUF4442 domain-containing protein [Longimicrobiales bacterium]|nr:DUF4442 domain-containing protein [Longimicrobiales bacterium]